MFSRIFQLCPRYNSAYYSSTPYPEDSEAELLTSNARLRTHSTLPRGSAIFRPFVTVIT